MKVNIYIIQKASDKKKRKHKTELYGINNFCSNNAIKITEKIDNSSIKIQCPQYRELSDEELTSKERKESDEDISDDRYLQYHSLLENNELNYRIKVTTSSNRKKHKPKNDSISHSASTDTNII